MPRQILRRVRVRCLASLVDSKSPVTSISRPRNGASGIFFRCPTLISHKCATPTSLSIFHRVCRYDNPQLSRGMRALRSFALFQSKSTRVGWLAPCRWTKVACMFCLRLSNPNTLDRAFVTAVSLDSWTFFQWRQNAQLSCGDWAIGVWYITLEIHHSVFSILPSSLTLFDPPDILT